MGLDVVELIMRVEEEFDIVIEDKEAELAATPGTLCALVERKLADGVSPQPRDTWLKLQGVIADERGIPLDKVTRDADFCRDLGMG